ncbi:Receptor-like protein 12 [Cucumis melo var. makuwa]|uniref:Receptor-like protein 12 n=1 Tax=Cucumis melo var. makuwa TaxID=1194695 RepID=A0A5A7UMS9_CUCMM|nr:Receptor-like protein 12 [Cucumis melo var. makuwa]
MVEEETIEDFNVKVVDLVNESFALEEKIPESKMVQNVIRSLPSRFNMKVTAIEKANDITAMKLHELFGSLRTFELSFDDHSQKKKGGIAFQGICEESLKHPQKPKSDENLVEPIALLSRRFTKFKSKFYKRTRNNDNQFNREPSDASYSRSGSSNVVSFTHRRKDKETTSDSDWEEQRRALISCQVEEVQDEIEKDTYVTLANTESELQTETCESQKNKESEFSLADFNELLCLWNEVQETLRQHRTLSLENILSEGISKHDKKCVGFTKNQFSNKLKSPTFVPTSEQLSADDVPQSSKAQQLKKKARYTQKSRQVGMERKVTENCIWEDSVES